MSADAAVLYSYNQRQRHAFIALNFSFLVSPALLGGGGGGVFHKYVQQQYFLHAHSMSVDVLEVAGLPQQQHSISIPPRPRPNTLTLSCTLPC